MTLLGLSEARHAAVPQTLNIVELPSLRGGRPQLTGLLEYARFHYVIHSLVPFFLFNSC